MGIVAQVSLLRGPIGQLQEQRGLADVWLADEGGGFAVAQSVEDGTQFIPPVQELTGPHRAAIDEG